VVVVTLVGCLLERLAIRPLRSAPVITMIIVTIGASVLLRGAALAIWGTGSHRVEPFSGEESLAFAGATVRPQDLWVAGTMAVALLAVYLFFRFTVTGMAMRACAINRRAARLVGISVERMNLLSFGLSAALGGLAGVVFSPLTMPQYATGTALALKGFCGAIVGGLGNSAGAVVGGLLLGVVEAIGAGFAPEYLHIPSGYKDAFALVILLLVLLLRPRGLLGARHQEGV
jgi:branched-chain amino acid transport system permease protein